MMPKSYLVFKWAVYSLATAGFFALQYLVLGHVRVLGLTPLLYTVLPAVAASFEGLRRGSVFALAVGVVCDLLLPGPFEGFYTLGFTAAALLAALIAENLLAPGFLCGFAVSALSLAVTALLRLGAQALSGGGYLGLMARMALVEALITLPAVVLVVPVYRLIHQRCASDY